MIKIIGIDPAPSKGSTIFDGENFIQNNLKGFKDKDRYQIGVNQLRSYLKDLAESKDDILICWDAPLSFSMECETPFSKRIIEKFFSRKDGYITPDGISVMGYSTCPHWMISQYILGYPKVSSFDKEFKPPFNLVFDKNSISKSITEVHPAVAIWLWCKQGTTRKNWVYKKDDKVFKGVVEILKNKGIIPEEIVKSINNDDKLDAYIAWKLGDLWVKNNDDVIILGDNRTGSLLLPKNENVIRGFNKFKE